MGSFYGDLSIIHLADLFQALSTTGKEGTLSVFDGESRKTIYFSRDGISLIVTGARKGEMLGDLLVRSGKITQRELEKALARQKETSKLLGEVLESMGFLSEEEIRHAVRTQIEEEIYDVFTWRDAFFEFAEGAVSAEDIAGLDDRVTSLKFDVNALVFEAARRIDGWTRIHQELPNEFVKLEKRDSSVMSDEQRADPLVMRVYAACSGERTALDIAKACHNTGRFVVFMIIHDLLKAGAIVKTETALPPEVEAKRQKLESIKKELLEIKRATENQNWARDTGKAPTTPEEPPPKPRTAEPGEVPQPATPPAKPPTILVVDDTANLRKVVCYTLKRNNYLTLEAENGQVALDTLVNNKVDAVLLDVMMPVMNGIDACQRIRENPHTKHIPVIMLTARNDRETVIRVAKAGATDCVIKPFNQALLIERVAKAIKYGHGKMCK